MLVVGRALLGLHRRWERLRDPGSAPAYLRSVVLNRCPSLLRRRAIAARFGHVHEAPACSAESAALLREEYRELLATVAGLTCRQREVLVLRYFCDLSDEETARTLRVSRGTVSSTASRALAALARQLGEES